MEDQKNHGANRCPKCGASEIEYSIKKGKLICIYCHTEFDSEKQDDVDIESINGVCIGDGSKLITNENDLITLKCNNCGAEVIINTKENTNSRCHWCHSILSINSKIGNGVVPDLVLPFNLDIESAKRKINNFVAGRKFFASKKFKKEFKTDNIIGVYFPYLLIDCFAHANFCGKAGHVARSYSKVVGKDKDGNEEKKTFYDIDLYDIVRDFDITIDDFEIESSKDKINKNSKEKTTNIINSIMPFDTNNCVKYKSNYLVGFNVEKRDLNIANLQEKIDKSLKDIVRYSIIKDLKYYDAGVSWKHENVDFKGKKILSAYLPVWLYSYQDKNKIIHYVAVNGRTGETMGSIPLNKIRLAVTCISLFLLVLCIPIIIMLFSIDFSKEEIVMSMPPLFFGFIIGLVLTLILLFVTLSKYRNKGARHNYEIETKTSINNLEKQDIKRKTLYEESFSFIDGVNANKLEGENVVTK